MKFKIDSKVDVMSRYIHEIVYCPTNIGQKDRKFS